VSDQYERNGGTGRRPAPTDEEIEKMSAGVFSGGGECAALCRELQTASEALEGTTGLAKARLIARMRAINLMRKSLNCPQCFFE
jgi:hypothetical protein